MTSLVVQWLRLHASNAGDAGSIPGQGTKILYAVQLKIKVVFVFFFKKPPLEKKIHQPFKTAKLVLS